MPDIIVQARNYPSPYDHFNGTRRLNIAPRDYLRASLTVGFQSGRDARTGNRRLRVDRYLNGIRIYNMLIERPEGLCLAPEFTALDMSEKGPHSYWHGTILAKIVADRLLGIPWLANVDAMRQQGRVKISAATKERGDFVGRDRQLDWHALEAKGRSTPVDADLIDEAKTQAARIVSVDQKTPKTSTGCVTDFSTTPITVFLDDPPPESDEARRIVVENFWGFYYGNIARFIENSSNKGRVDGLEDYTFARLFVVPDGATELSATELYLGLPQAIIRNPANVLEMPRGESANRSPYVGSDHVALAGPMTEWPTRLLQPR